MCTRSGCGSFLLYSSGTAEIFLTAFLRTLYLIPFPVYLSYAWALPRPTRLAQQLHARCIFRPSVRPGPCRADRASSGRERQAAQQTRQRGRIDRRPKPRSLLQLLSNSMLLCHPIPPASCSPHNSRPVPSRPVPSVPSFHSSPVSRQTQRHQPRPTTDNELAVCRLCRRLACFLHRQRELGEDETRNGMAASRGDPDAGGRSYIRIRTHYI